MRQWIDRLEDFLAKPAPTLLIVSGAIIIGFLNALPHMQEALWQDEAATIALHATRGLTAPFLHYISPNNHLAFSSMLAAWIMLFPDGVEIFTLRLLPLLLFLSAVPIIYFAARRMGGPLSASIAVLAFSLSPVTGNFATQLRGYGPSWPFLSAFLICGLNIFSIPYSRPWKVGYALSGLIAVALLPTNFFFAAVMSVALVGYHLSAGVRVGRSTAVGYALILMVPAACLLVAYAGVWKELMTFKDVGFSTWSLPKLGADWLRGTWGSLGWFVVLAAAGMAVGIQDLAQRLYSGKSEIAPEFLAVAILVFGFGIAVVSIPTTPFPRSLVPYLPIWLAALSCLASYGLKRISRSAGQVAFGIGATIAVGSAWAASPVPSCRDSQGSGDPFEYSLCYQYFRDQYYPSRVLDVWASLQNVDIPIVSDFEGFRALEILGSPAKIHEFRNFQPSDRTPPLLVAHDDAAMRLMAEYLGLAPSSYALIADTGYFNVYGPMEPP